MFAGREIDADAVGHDVSDRGDLGPRGSRWRHVAEINGIVAATATEDADTIFPAANGVPGVCSIAANDIAAAAADDVLDGSVCLTTLGRGAPGQQASGRVCLGATDRWTPASL